MTHILFRTLSLMSHTLILFIINFGSGDEIQPVINGPCLNKNQQFINPNAYCHSKVSNSYCSNRRNRCFCKDGYSAVRVKDNQIACTSLLTSLKCDIDEDCSDVHGSTCHPEAGECICPAFTVFNPVKHSCEFFVATQNPYCKMCRHVQGVCASPTDEKKPLQREYSCICPGITKSGITGYRSPFNDQRSNLISNNPNNPNNPIPYPGQSVSNINDESLCDSLRLDIGDWCALDSSRQCTTLNSQCFGDTTPLFHRHSVSSTALFNQIRPGSDTGRCRCKEGFIAVYQKNLGYHMCYKQQNKESKKVNICESKGGQSINMDGSNDVNACVCQGISERILYYDKNSQQFVDDHGDTRHCMSINKIVKVTCAFQQIKSCIDVDQNEMPHLYNQILENKTRIFYSDRIRRNIRLNKHNSISPNISMNCLFRIRQKTKSLISLCQQAIFDDKLLTFPCGIKLTRYKNSNLYSGYIEIWSDLHFSDVIHDKLIDITCKAKSNSKSLGQAIDSSWPRTSSQELSRQYYSPIETTHGTGTASNIIFQVLDNKNKVVKEPLSLRTPIRLQATMSVKNSRYQFISAEKCWVQNASHFAGYNTYKMDIIERGCSVDESGFTSNFRPSYNLLVIDSNLFPLFKVGNSSTVYFKCIFRLCTKKEWCLTTSSCNIKPKPQYSIHPIPSQFNQIKHAVKATYVILKLPNSIHSNSKATTGNGIKVCRYFWCMSRLKLSLTTLVLSGIVLLSIGILTLVCYRHRVIRRLEQCQQHHISTQQQAQHNNHNNYSTNPISPNNKQIHPSPPAEYMLLPTHNKSTSHQQHPKFHTPRIHQCTNLPQYNHKHTYPLDDCRLYHKQPKNDHNNNNNTLSTTYIATSTSSAQIPKTISFVNNDKSQTFLPNIFPLKNFNQTHLLTNNSDFYQTVHYTHPHQYHTVEPYTHNQQDLQHPQHQIQYSLDNESDNNNINRTGNNAIQNTNSNISTLPYISIINDEDETNELVNNYS